MPELPNVTMDPGNGGMFIGGLVLPMWLNTNPTPTRVTFVSTEIDST